MITYRDYQLNAIQAAIALILMGKRRLILLSPTGSGKTVMAAMLVLRAIAKGKRVLFLAHRRELIEQTVDKLVAAGVLNFGVIMAGNRLNNANAPVQVASIQTLIRRELPPADLILIDECHRAAARQYQAVIANYPNAVVIGLTATPERTDGKGLDDLFDDMVPVETVPNLIEQGYLVKPTCYVGPTADLSGVRTKRGDYDEQQLAEAMDRPKLVGDIVTNWKRLANGKQTVAFSVNVAHAEHIAAEFRAAGVSAAMVSGETPRAQREAIIADWKAGYIQVVSNALVFCLDIQTEILTDQGFVRHDEISAQHKVANWTFDGSIYFKEPEEIVKRELYDFERMAVVETPYVNIRVTDTHRMIYQTGRDKRWEKTAASDLVGKRFSFPVCGNAEPVVFDDSHRKRWVSASRARFVATNAYNYRTKNGLTYQESVSEAERLYDIKSSLVSKLPHELTVDECYFIGFWIGDGSINKLRRGGVEYTASQSTVYPDIIDWFDGVIGRTGIDSIKRKKSAPKNQKTQNDWFSWSFPRGTGGRNQDRKGVFQIEPYLDKNGSYLLNGLNRDQILALVYGLWMADGDHTQNQNRIIHNTNKGLLDLLQSILICRGVSATITESTRNNAKDHWKPIYSLTYAPNKTRRQVSSLDASKRMRLEDPADGEIVWCVKTDSKNLITRRNGRICVMGNTEGFDYPELECCILARPTQSISMYLQQVGRVMRPAPGKTGALILDHAGCCQLHGQPHIDREWTLEGMAKKRKDKSREADALKVCHVCAMAYESEPKLWLAETQPSLREAFNPVATKILRGKAADRGMDTCPGCGTASCLTCNDSFVPKLSRRDIDGIAWETLASCPSCHAHYVDDVPHLITDPTETEIPDSTNDQLVEMDENAIPTKVIVMNDYKKLLNEARQKGRKRGWAWHKLKERYDESTLREHLPRHTANWWRAQA